MKKILLLTAAVVFSVALMAQNTTYNFDDGTLQGWTTIDADGDGHVWVHSDNNPEGYDYTGSAHSGTGFALSYSFIDFDGAYDANNYFVSPQKYAASSVEFYYDYANESYPDFFEVMVSTADNPDASDFTSVWAVTSKSGGSGKAEMRHPANNRLGNWREVIIDLSEYAGQELWIAFHHQDYDAYRVFIDDVTIVTGDNPSTGEATIILTVGDVWGDGSGYQMLLDDTHSLYGTTIPETGALSANCTGNEAIYAQFSHKIPVNADGECTTQNIVLNNSISIVIPPGTYDWCITNPTPGDKIWIASSQGNVGGRYDDYVFEAGYTYEFNVYRSGMNDATDVTITETPTTVTYTITAVAEPAGYGTVEGAGEYEEGETCTLRATANDEYMFINWTKDGEVVSEEAVYSFTVTENASYVAHFQYDNVKETEEHLFVIFPNPVNERLMIRSQFTVRQYDVYSITGSLILSMTVDSDSFEVQVKDLAAGSYLIRLTSDDVVQTRRFVKR